MDSVETLLSEYRKLDALARIQFLEWVYANDKHKWDYAAMDTGTRRFYQSFKDEGV